MYDVYIMAMVRKQVYITREQDEALKRIARKRGVTEADVVRQAIDREEAEAESEDERRREAGRKLVEFLRHRAATVPGRTERWTREDAYDDERSRRLHR